MRPIDADIDDVLGDVVNVLVERESGRSQTYHSEVRQAEDIIYLLPGVWQNIYNSLLTLDQSLAPLDGLFPAGEQVRQGVLSGAVKRFVKKVIQKSVYWYVNPVVAQLHSLHAATARAVRELADRARITSDRLEVIERENLDGRIGSLEGVRFDERMGRLERAWKQGAAGPTRAEAPSAPVQGEPEPAAGGGGGVMVPERAAAPFQFDYYWFESIHRGDRELIKQRQQPYLEYFEGCSDVLDIGCGRGEFLELMMERGIGGYGIDIEPDAVQYCTDSGLRAELAEAVAHLSSLPDESLDGVFLSQVVEHVTADELIKMVGLIYNKMKPGGAMVIETPNPQCLLIFASFFYADLSHVQPIHPETMRFLMQSAGFRDIETRMTNPVPRNQRLSKITVPDSLAGESWVDNINANVEKINSVLFSYLDYVAVARK